MASFSTETIKLISDALKKSGITSPALQLGIIAVVTTEGSLSPKSEMSYASTPVKRLRDLFGSRLKKYSDAQIEILKKDNVKFYDIIYGGEFGKKYGNSSAGDGWKYRGRGFNAITFKDQYSKYGKKIGVDLLSNPDRLNEPAIAAIALALFFADGFAAGKSSGLLKQKFGVSQVNEITDVVTATKAAFQVNAGWKTSIDSSSALKEEHRKQLAVLPALLEAIKKNPATSAGIGLAGSAAVALMIFFLMRSKKPKRKV